MKLFRYPMENVLDYRRDVEEEEKQKFAEIRREYDRQQAVVDEYKEKISMAEKSIINKSTLLIHELKSLYHYIRFLKEKMELQRQLVLETKREMEVKRQELLSVQKDRKMMEKHREKALNIYNEDMNQLEQKNIDELALYSYMRR